MYFYAEAFEISTVYLNLLCVKENPSDQNQNKLTSLRSMRSKLESLNDKGHKVQQFVLCFLDKGGRLLGYSVQVPVHSRTHEGDNDSEHFTLSLGLAQISG